MAGNEQLHLVRNRNSTIIEVTGPVDEETAIALGELLDDELTDGSVLTVRIVDAEISMIGWAVLERAARTSARRAAWLQLEPDPGPLTPARRTARAWLEIVGDACRQSDSR